MLPPVRREGLVVAGGAILAAAAVFLRAWAHPRHVLDLEGTFVSIAGRQLAHGHVRDFLGYQIDWYRGEPVVDGALSALGFLLFGDHLAAWLLVSLLWVVLGVLAAGTILRRLDNPVGAALIGVLVACGPLVLKDGLASNTVGHAATPVIVLLGMLPLLPRAARPPPGLRAGLLAGAIVGGAIWYQRTAVLAVPALLVVAGAGGRRVVFGSLLGLASFPILVLLNAALLMDVGGPRTGDGYGAVVHRALFGVEGGSVGDRAWLRALADPLGFGLQPLLNAPVPPDPSTAPSLPAKVQAWLWPVACVVGLVAACAPIRRDTLRRLALPLLALAWTAGYAMTEFEAEPTLFGLLEQKPAPAPSTSGTRYLIPCMFLWTAVLAQGLGRWWSDLPGRIVAAALAGVLAIGGLGAVRDVSRHPEATSAFATSLPFEYVGVYGRWIGPERRWHTQCDSDDPTCRAHHWRTLGATSEPSRRLREGPRIEFPIHFGDRPLPIPRQLAVLVEELQPTERERLFLAHGMGIEMARAAAGVPDADGMLELVARLRGVLRMLDPDAARAMAIGFVEHARVGSFGSIATPLGEELCAPLHGERRLCALLADVVEPAPMDEWLEKTSFLADVAASPAEEETLRLELLRGLGIRLGRVQPPGTWAGLTDGLSADRAAALQDGLAIGGRGRWRTTPSPQTPPWRHP